MESFREDCILSLGPQGAAALDTLRQGTLVITGGTGFVGLWLTTLCAHLNDSHNFGISLILTARHRARIENTAPFLAQRKDVRFVGADIRQFIDIPAAASWIIHAAGTPDARAHAANPMEIMDVISSGTYRVLRAAEQCRDLRMLLNVSSASVYGSQPAEMDALPENFVGRLDPATTVSAYAEAKRYGEALCASARSQSRTPVVIARPFTFIGPFQALDAPWAINNFLHAALHQQPLKILGNGETRRTFLYGSDAAVLLLKMLVSGRNSDIFNIGHPDAISLRDLAAQVVARSRQSLEIKINTIGDHIGSAHLVPDMNKAKERFGFQPAFGIGPAIERTLAWHRARALQST